MIVTLSLIISHLRWEEWEPQAPGRSRSQGGSQQGPLPDRSIQGDRNIGRSLKATQSGLRNSYKVHPTRVLYTGGHQAAAPVVDVTRPQVDACHPIAAVARGTRAAVSGAPGVDTRDPGAEAAAAIVHPALVQVSAVVARPRVPGGTGATREAPGGVDTRDHRVLTCDHGDQLRNRSVLTLEQGGLGRAHSFTSTLHAGPWPAVVQPSSQMHV